MIDHVFFCPSCGARYDVAASVVATPSLVLLCGMCGHAAQTNAAAMPSSDPTAPTAAELSLIEAQQPRIVVGHEVPAAARSIAAVLRRAGYSPACVRSGEMVLSACDPAMPAPPSALVLDVAIPGVLAFEVIAQLRAHPATTELPIILLASVFERTRYKRRPTNLYGADTYLELHHVPDRLAPIIQELRAKKTPGPDRWQAPVERARAAGLRSRPPIGTGVGGDAEAAQALARRLLSDVALYHGDELADGVRRGVPFASLTSAVDAARDLFRAALIGGDASSERAGALSTVALDVFEAELVRFAHQLLERSGSSAPGHAAPGRGRRVDG